jgi:hypothetical protein
MTAQYEFHRLANLFPLIEGPEFTELVEDIRANGLREMIVLHEGRILDGRNRYRACLEAGVNPTTTEWNANWSPHSRGGPLGYVLSVNLHRRHLTTQQRTAIAAELATMKSLARTDLAPNDARSAMSDAQAAEALKVSERSVERAKRRMREDPEAHEKAKAGTLGRKKPEPKKAKPEAAAVVNDSSASEPVEIDLASVDLPVGVGDFEQQSYQRVPTPRGVSGACSLAGNGGIVRGGAMSRLPCSSRRRAAVAALSLNCRQPRHAQWPGLCGFTRTGWSRARRRTRNARSWPAISGNPSPIPSGPSRKPPWNPPRRSNALPATVLAMPSLWH